MSWLREGTAELRVYVGDGLFFGKKWLKIKGKRDTEKNANERRKKTFYPLFFPLSKEEKGKKEDIQVEKSPLYRSLARKELWENFQPRALPNGVRVARRKVGDR